MIPRAGDRVGPFLLLSELGKGGSAPVWLAHETYGSTVLRPAAVKLFHVHVSSSGGSDSGSVTSDAERRRIATEGRLLSAVEHPGIVRFYALVEDEKRGLVGLAMEVAQGTSLEERLVESDTLLDVAEVARIGEAMASALAAVHRAGLVHRDVKPANIVESGGVYKLVDFGLAGLSSGASVAPAPLPDTVPLGTKISTLHGPTTTAGTQGIAGTVGYVDPAMLGEGLSPSPASDLYGLGATLYELLTGHLPAATAGGLSGHVLDGRAHPPALLSQRPDVLPAFAELVDRLVLPNRADRPSSAERVTSELGRIRRALLGAARALPPEETGPFRGLLRFEAPDRDVYFGRTAEIASTLELLRTRGFVTLVGPSGSGKSSLARAGIIPAIREGALGFPARWDALTVAPGRDPWATVGGALSTWLELDPATSPSLGAADLVSRLVERVEREGRGILLVVDQLEELAMLVGREHAESRARTVELLSLLAERILPGVRVLGTVRGDLLEVLLGTSGLARAVFRGSVPVSPLSELAWEEVSEEALSVYGYRFEDPALAAEITAELRTYASAMPLVQFALSQLWARRDRARKLITREAWLALGGIRGALDRHGDATLAELLRVRPSAEEEVRDVLLALTTLQGTRATRSQEELARSGDRSVVIAALVEARLLVEEGDRLTLAHEALLGEWGKLRSFLAEARRERWLASDVEQAAERLRVAPDTAALLEGPRLAAALAVVSAGHVTLSSDALRLVSESQLAVRRARRKSALVYASVSVSVLFLLTFVSLALLAARARERVLGDRVETLERRLREVSPTGR